VTTGDHFDYLGRSLSPPPSAVKLFQSRTGGEQCRFQSLLCPPGSPHYGGVSCTLEMPRRRRAAAISPARSAARPGGLAPVVIRLREPRVPPAATGLFDRSPPGHQAVSGVRDTVFLPSWEGGPNAQNGSLRSAAKIVRHPLCRPYQDFKADGVLILLGKATKISTNHKTHLAGTRLSPNYRRRLHSYNGLSG
jgi:hypothetical protein